MENTLSCYLIEANIDSQINMTFLTPEGTSVDFSPDSFVGTGTMRVVLGIDMQEVQGDWPKIKQDYHVLAGGKRNI